jgi:mono/diheme cytochrome c family protein
MMVFRRMCAALIVCVAAAGIFADEAGGIKPPSYTHELRPLLASYCFDCHGNDSTKGDLNLETLSDDAAPREFAIWRKVMIKVSAHEMPPKKEKQLSAAERDRIMNWIRQARASAPKDPGRVTAHRLNRSEYNNTIRDLLGVDAKPADDFPSDDVGEGFDNIADVLALQPLLLEKYLAAAESILATALVDEILTVRVEAEKMTATIAGQPVEVEGEGEAAGAGTERTFSDNAELAQLVSFPDDGKYTFKVRTWVSGSGPAPLALKIDDKLVKEFHAKGSAKNPSIQTAKIDVKAGQHRLVLSYISVTDEKPKPAAVPRGRANAPAAPPDHAPAPARSASIDYIDIQGPPQRSLPETHKRIMISKPDDKVSKEAAARLIIQRFAERAFRRPLSVQEVDRLCGLFSKADTAGEGFVESIRLALKAVLVSPHFLFRFDCALQDEGSIRRLDDWQLASRLSYFLWSTMPDDLLFEAARSGTLHEPETLRAQTLRMLKDPKARALVDNFAAQWLQLRKLETVTPDPKMFPDFDPDLRKAMYDEAASSFEAVMREDKSVLDFLDAKYTYVNDRLSRHYGMTGISGANMRKVDLGDRQRGGVVCMAGILTATSNPNRTSPVKRGKFILEQLLGDPTPPPPPDVPDLPERDNEAVKEMSLRQILEQHRDKAACVSCHQRLDPPGFGLENYDAIGKWREKDGNQFLDTKGELPGGQSFNGPAGLKAIIADIRKDNFIRCLTQKMLVYALGRGLTDSDDAAIDVIADDLHRADHRFSQLAVGIVMSYPFQYHRTGASP